ncbi:MAG TPA: FtsX-like permease family protein, partial [Acidimicrobiales bacterium]|nr:FtsX-like permease family protein [Acidimicrobiales bacterium]
AGEVAMTSAVAADFSLHIGDLWHSGGSAYRLVGIVQNPLELLDQFALVSPGQVARPDHVAALFDLPPGVSASSLGAGVQRQGQGPSSSFNPTTITVTVMVLGMLLIGLVSVGGFTVLAQRRLRSIGMLASLGATDRHLRLVVRTNGLVVGAVGAVLGTVLGLTAWLAYRPSVQHAAHHVIGVWQLPWPIIAGAAVLALVTTYAAASRPAAAMARVPVVTALSGRPAPPPRLHRSFVPGVVALVLAFLFLGFAGASGGRGGGVMELAIGFIALAVGAVLVAPFTLSLVGNAHLVARAPVALRLALRDLARFRTRSGSALAAITLSVLVAGLVCVVGASRYGNQLDYVGSNLASNQMLVSTPQGPYWSTGGPGIMIGPDGQRKVIQTPGLPSASQIAAWQSEAGDIAGGLGARVFVPLEITPATLTRHAPGRNFSGAVFVATPALLRALGVPAAAVDPRADVITMRGQLSTMSDMVLELGQGGPGIPACQCLRNPIIQTVPALPSGTSAPNTLITEHAVQEFHLQTTTAEWWLQMPTTVTAAQISQARQLAATDGLSVETKSDAPTSTEVLGVATVAGLLLALAILAMTLGLIRSETAGDLRTLTATGASSRTRRAVTAAIAAALGVLGGVVGIACAYLAAVAFLRSNANGDNLSELAHVPWVNLLVLVEGLPLVAAIVGFVFAGRQPPGVSHQPLK